MALNTDRRPAAGARHAVGLRFLQQQLHLLARCRVHRVHSGPAHPVLAASRQGHRALGHAVDHAVIPHHQRDVTRHTHHRGSDLRRQIGQAVVVFGTVFGVLPSKVA